jgi:hypothetical protein
MADVDQEILDKAREVIATHLLAKIEKEEIRPRLAAHANDDCLEVFYEGTATPVKAGCDVEWDVINETDTVGHFNDLETEQLIKDWLITIPKTDVMNTVKKQICTDPQDSKEPLTKEMILTFPEDSVLFKGFPHGSHTDQLKAKTKSVVKLKVQIIITFRRWKCLLGMVPESVDLIQLAPPPVYTGAGESDPANAVALGLGRVFALMFVSIAHAEQLSQQDRTRLRRRGLELWDQTPSGDRLSLIVAHKDAVAEGFRRALVNDYRTQAEEVLGFTAADFAHLKDNTPGNPDVTAGAGGTATDEGTFLVGPTITVKHKDISITFGAGPEVDHQPVAATVSSGDDLVSAAGKAVRGAGVWIGLRINC